MKLLVKKNVTKDFESSKHACQFTTFFNAIIEGVALHMNFFYMIFLRFLVKFFSEPEILKSLYKKQKINYDFPAMLTKSTLSHSYFKVIQYYSKQVIVIKSFTT